MSWFEMASSIFCAIVCAVTVLAVLAAIISEL